MYELQILMGFNCNFKCNHCLNDSAPGRKDSELSEREIQSLISSISKNTSIKHVSFSGGEPLLYTSKIAKIAQAIRKERLDIKLSITTNGSLLEKSESILKELNIDYCMLSYDKEHSQFFSSDKFVNSLALAKNIFRQIELNITYADQPSVDHIKSYLIENNIKVNFNKKIESGRQKMSAQKIQQDYELRPFSCPNINLDINHIKITYIPNHGYTVCCGPVVFDKIVENGIAYFEDLTELQNNFLFNFLNKTRTSHLLLQKEVACDTCKCLLKKISKKEMQMFLDKNNWNNVLLEWSEHKLEVYNSIFNPKFIKKVEINSFHNYLNNYTSRSPSKLKEFTGSSLNEKEIEDFSAFTIESFYNIHNKFYHITDIQRFKSDQKIFFNLPYKYLYHKLDNKIVGYLTVCKIKSHPFFKETAWHVGYWGISAEIERTEKELIKLSWAKLLQDLNKESILGANIDYFNKPADIMSTKFNFKTVGLRLDPRQ